jgi:hypothetical protein
MQVQFESSDRATRCCCAQHSRSCARFAREPDQFGNRRQQVLG